VRTRRFAIVHVDFAGMEDVDAGTT